MLGLEINDRRRFSEKTKETIEHPLTSCNTLIQKDITWLSANYVTPERIQPSLEQPQVLKFVKLIGLDAVLWDSPQPALVLSVSLFSIDLTKDIWIIIPSTKENLFLFISTNPLRIESKKEQQKLTLIEDCTSRLIYYSHLEDITHTKLIDITQLFTLLIFYIKYKCFVSKSPIIQQYYWCLVHHKIGLQSL